MIITWVHPEMNPAIMSFRLWSIFQIVVGQTQFGRFCKQHTSYMSCFFGDLFCLQGALGMMALVRLIQEYFGFLNAELNKFLIGLESYNKMIEIKQIIKSRIRATLQLKETIINPQIQQQEKYKKLLIQKRQERVRSIKQSDILLTLNRIKLNSSENMQEFFDVSVEICSAYDPRFQQYSYQHSNSMKDSVQILYTQFLIEHGLKAKLKLIEQILNYDLEIISPSILLGWLSEWSKRVYCEMLQNQLREDMKNWASVKEGRNSLFMRKPIKKAKQTSKVQISSNRVVGRVDNPKQPSENVFLYKKQNVYSYFLLQLGAYYRNFQLLEDLDITFPKNIRKQGKKEDILHQKNLDKAAQVMINLTLNSEINMKMMDYELSFYKRFPKKKFSKAISMYEPQIASAPQSPKKCIRPPTQIILNQKLKNNAATATRENFCPKMASPRMTMTQLYLVAQGQVSPSSNKCREVKGISQAKKYNLQFPKISKQKINQYSQGMLPLPETYTKDTNRITQRIHELKEQSHIISDSVHESSFVKFSSRESNLTIQNKISRNTIFNFNIIQQNQLRQKIQTSLIEDDQKLISGKWYSPEEGRKTQKKKGFSGGNIIKRK